MNWDKSCHDSFHAMLLSCIDLFSKGKQVLRNVKSVLIPLVLPRHNPNQKKIKI